MIIIAKDSMYLEYFEGGEKKVIEIDHDNTSITRYMEHIVYIEEGVTVLDLFNHMGKDPELIDAVFDSSLGGYEFVDFLDEAVQPAKPDELLKHAVFEHKCNMDSDELLHEVRFIVIGTHPNDDELVPYSVELSPIYTYSNLEVKIDTKFTITRTETVNDEDIEMTLFDAHKPMTLFEIFSSLLYEVSCHGTPEMRQEAFDEMKAAVLARIQQDDEDMSATLLASSLEDEIKALENELEESISAEDYETSAALRDKINDLKRKRSSNPN